MRDIIYSSFGIFSLWVWLCRKFQIHESRLKQSDIFFHPLLILKIPFSKEIFNLNNKFVTGQKKLDGKNSRIFFSMVVRIERLKRAILPRLNELIVFEQLLFKNGNRLPGLQSYRDVSFIEMNDFFYYISTEDITIVNHSLHL